MDSDNDRDSPGQTPPANPQRNRTSREHNQAEDANRTTEEEGEETVSDNEDKAEDPSSPKPRKKTSRFTKRRTNRRTQRRQGNSGTLILYFRDQKYPKTLDSYFGSPREEMEEHGYVICKDAAHCQARDLFHYKKLVDFSAHNLTEENRKLHISRENHTASPN